MFEEIFEESKNEYSKEIFEIYRVDAEVLSSEESSLLAGPKCLSELRQVESIEFSVAGVDVSCNLHYFSLQSSVIRLPRKEEVLRSSSNSLSFEEVKTKGSNSMLRLGFSRS